MLLPIIRDKSHDPFIIFGGLFSRDLIFSFLQGTFNDENLTRLTAYCEDIKQHCPSEDHLQKKIAEYLIDGTKLIPKNSQGDIFFENVVVEVKNKPNELNLDSLVGSIKVPSGRRRETAEEELFRYLKLDNISWGILTSGRIFRFYHSATDIRYIEFDLFDIVASRSKAHATLFLSLLNDDAFRREMLDKTTEIRTIQAEQKLLLRVKSFYSKAIGSRSDLTKACLFFLTLKYLEDIGILPINSLEYKKNSLSVKENLNVKNLEKILKDFIEGRWFNGLTQEVFTGEDVDNIQTVIGNEKNQRAILTLLFDESGVSVSLSDIYIDHLGNIYQTYIHNHAEGAYYTPFSIGKKLSEYLISLNQNSRMKFAQNNDKVIIDPCCGSGQLLRALIPFAHNFYDHSGSRYKPKNSMRRDFISRLVGIDKDEESVFICKVGLGLMGAEEGLGLATPRLVKKENTLDAFLDSRRNFLEINRENIYAIVTNPPWESLEFNMTQLYRRNTGAGLPKKSSIRKATGQKLLELQKLERQFESWTKNNKQIIAAEEERVNELSEVCEKVAIENPEFFKGKKNLALFFMYIVNRLLDDSSGAYIVVLPDRFFVGEDCPIRDRLFNEIEAYMPFQNCGRIFEGVANGTRFGVVFGRKGGSRDYLFADIPVVEGTTPVDFESKKIMKSDLKVGEVEQTASGNIEKKILPFFKNSDDIELLTNWIMHRQPIADWEQGKINLGNRNGPGPDFGSLGRENQYKFPVVKSSSYKTANKDKFKGILNIQFGVSVEKLPDRLKTHFKAKKAITSNIKSDGVRKIAVAIAENCLVEHDYNFNTSIDTSDLWWIQSLTFNHLVNSLSGSYHINTGLLDFLGGLSIKSKVPLNFSEREIFVLKSIGFSEQSAVEIVATILLSGFQEDFIKEIYNDLERSHSEQFSKIPADRLLIKHQRPLSLSTQANIKYNRHTLEIVSNRVAASAYIINYMNGDKSFGRIKLEKCLYMLEAMEIADLHGQYQRKAAGPLDSEALYNKKYGIESFAAQKDIFTTNEIVSGSRKRISYLKGTNFKIAVTQAENVFGTNLKKANALLKIMKQTNSEQAEIIATVFAAWNDLIQAGVNPNSDLIINEVRKNWAATKERFTPNRLKIALTWLSKMKLIPTGNGPRTLK